MNRSLGQASHPIVPLSSQHVMGYLMHESKVGSTCAGCASVAAPCQWGKESAEHACKHGYQTIN